MKIVLASVSYFVMFLLSQGHCMENNKYFEEFPYSTNGKVMTDIKNEDSLLFQNCQLNYFERIPNDIIIMIAFYLHDQDFLNLSYTSTRTKNIITSYKNFFISEDLDKVRDTIEKTNPENLSDLFLNWGRNKKKSITVLRQILPYFNEYQSQPERENLKLESEKTKNYVIVINLLYKFGDKKAEESFKYLYNIIQNALCTEHAEVNQELYIFHLKNLSLLVPSVRKEISDGYKNGTSPFNINFEESNLYSLDLDLPLNSSIFHKI